MLNSTTDFMNSRIYIPREAIGSLNSRDHVILQGLDVILGSKGQVGAAYSGPHSSHEYSS
jgi:hypothetical protein